VLFSYDEASRLTRMAEGNATTGDDRTDFAIMAAAGDSWAAAMLKDSEGIEAGSLELTIALALIPGPLDEAAAGVNLTGFTRHGINQAISRNGAGVSTRAILDAVRNPVKILAQSGGRRWWSARMLLWC
jgi:hypothetical protein